MDAPTSTYEDEEVENFYEKVSKILRENKSYYKIVIEDFNAKVGAYQQGDGAVVGHYGYGERNERGTRLVQFATSENVDVNESKWTSKNHIDYMLINRKEHCGKCRSYSESECRE